MSNMIKHWVTKEGEKLAIRDMDSEHINNCIVMLRRLQNEDPGEQFYVGESWAAETAVEHENKHNQYLREKIIRFIQAFEWELNRRLAV